MIDRILRRLARAEDRALLDGSPSRMLRLRVIARIGLRSVWGYLVVLFLLATVTVASGMDVYHRTEMPQFCAGCHEMDENFESWNESLHADITCVDCHAKPGLAGFVEAKIAGMTQLWIHVTSDSIEDIRINQNSRETVSENCVRCHPGALRLEERSGLTMAHQRHADAGVACIDCHTGAFAHPSEEARADPRPGLVDRASCATCHDGRTEVWDVVAFAANDEKNCDRCHQDAVLGLDHGAGGEKQPTTCVKCHERVEGRRHFTMKDADLVQMCGQCQESTAAEHESVHESFGKGQCNDCHRGMSQPFLYKTGPKPSEAMCMSCHTRDRDPDDPTAAGKPAGFMDDDTDLHEEHREYIEGGPQWCSSCHLGHASKESPFLIRVASGEDEEEPGTFERTDNGGTCSGGCHADDEMEYTREEAE